MFPIRHRLLPALMTVALGRLSGDSMYGAVVVLDSAADTALFERAPDNNLGGMTFIPVGMTSLSNPVRGLVRFDLTGALPAQAVINSASLDLRVVHAHFLSTHIYGLHRVLNDWGEGTKLGGGAGTGTLGAAASSGEATWRERMLGQAAWGQPGGEPNVDFVQAPSATLSIGGLGEYTFSSPELTADVRAWQNNAAANFGWMMMVENEPSFLSSARRFGSRESGLDGPKLVVSFTVPVRIGQVAVVDGQVRFQFQALAGEDYEVQHRPMADGGTWMTLTNIPARAEDGSIEVFDPVLPGTRFYRVSGP